MGELEVWVNFKNGSEADFTLLYQKFAPVMLRYGAKISKDRELVKDSLQQVFFSLWKSKENLSTPANIKHYLLKSLRCELLKKLNRQRTCETLPDDYCFEQEASFEAELIMAQTSARTKQKISAVLAQLPPRQREVIFLKYYANLKYEEIAAIMGIEQESAYKLTYKAIDKLQHLLLTSCVSLIVLMVSGL